MRIAVIGPGAVGGYFGGRLVQSGEDVWFLARGRTLAAIRERGLRVDSIKGDIVLPRVQIAERAEEVGPVDAVLVCVKAWQVPEVGPALMPLLGRETVVLPLQNGVEAPEQLARTIGTDRVLIGLCGILSMVVEPGHIRHFGLEPFLSLGEPDNRRTPRVERLHAALVKAGIQATIPDDIHVKFWQKFLYITSVGGANSVVRAPIGVVRQTPARREMLRRSMTEIAELARANGVKMPSDAVDRTMATVDGMPASATTSMQRDILEGRPSELESLCGAVVRLAGTQGLDLPVNKSIYGALLPSELRARGEMSFERL